MPEMTKAQREARVAALKRERAGYVQDGKDDRVKAVDAELRKYDDSDDKPKGRSAAKKATASKPEGDKA